MILSMFLHAICHLYIYGQFSTTLPIFKLDCFLIVVLKVLLYILYDNPLSYVLQDFLLSVDRLFILFFNEVQLTNFFLSLITLLVISSPNPRSLIFSPTLSSSFIVFHFAFRSKIPNRYFFYFCYWFLNYVVIKRTHCITSSL